MQATVKSKENYFPMLLSNGADAALVDYSGSMMAGCVAHAHFEQYQGVALGWYKTSHSKYAEETHKFIQPIIRTGYQVIVDGESWDINDYCQQFDPVKAVLTTNVKIGGVDLRIESFMTDRHILCENYHIQGKPAKSKVRIAFYLDEPICGMNAAKLRETSALKFKYLQDKSLAVDYAISLEQGYGIMASDVQPDGIDNYPYNGRGVYFDDVQRGWTASKFFVLVDTSDLEDFKKAAVSTMKNVKRDGYAAVKREHIRIWKEYSDKSRISVPDKQMQYLYDLSQYSIRANQHREIGGITCGMLPNLWGGGVNVPYDAFFSHQALLKTNHLQEADHHLDFYRRQANDAKKLAAQAGLTGAAYSGWSNYLGRHLRANLKEHILLNKPVMAGFIVLKFYWQWKISGHKNITEKDIVQCREIVDFAKKYFIEDKGAFAVAKDCHAGNESDITVSNDTFTSLIYARTFAAYAEMAPSAKSSDNSYYREISEKLYKGLEANYKKGVLMPFVGAQYLAALQFDFFILNLPLGVNDKSVYACIEDSKTPWGLNTIQPEQNYRDWPWLGLRAAIALSHIKDGKECLKWITHVKEHISSLGALPEKIRIDGFPIGYWYSTCHSLFVWAMADALCHDGKDNDIRILYGLDGQWKDIEFKNIRLADGLAVSAKVCKGRLKYLKIKNTTHENIKRIIDVNPLYKNIKKQIVTINKLSTITVR
ncbi:MAG: hypothetical protein A2Y12_03325 [Planctomycetes bacterium GWF2_42_9]|nr:MAG: hypothetical protein A2Y12_03325 [Planctomycetes bacterium GWF2_42_9]